MNTSIQVFSNQYLEQGGTNAATITSQAVPAQGNKVKASIIMKNGASPGVDFYIDGSYDGLAWDELAATGSALTGLDHTTLEEASLDYAYVRARATAGTAGKGLFDVWLAFSEQ